MDKLFLTALLMGMSVSGIHAQNATIEPTFSEWHDLQVNAVNRFATHTDFFAFAPFENLRGTKFDMKKSANYLSLDGDWKFNWVENADQRPTDFFRTDFDDSQWKTFPVPGIWEVNGYGDPVYVNIGLHGVVTSKTTLQRFLLRKPRRLLPSYYPHTRQLGW